MKICPSCRRTYADDSLNFCLDDGTVLTQPADEREAETVMMNAPTPTRAARPLTTALPNPVQTEPFTMRPHHSKPRTWLWSILILGVLALLCGGGAAGLAWRAYVQNKAGSDVKLPTLPEKPPKPGDQAPEIPEPPSKPADGNAEAGLTIEKYRQLKDGMTYPEAVAILGSEGKSLQDSSGAGVRTETYQWTGDNFETIILTFQNGKLNSRTQVGLKSSSDESGKSNVTKEQYERLKDGMSYKEVIAILGTEGDEQFKSNIAGFAFATYQWKGSGFSSIIVTFQNDKLQSKSQVGL